MKTKKGDIVQNLHEVASDIVLYKFLLNLSSNALHNVFKLVFPRKSFEFKEDFDVEMQRLKRFSSSFMLFPLLPCTPIIAFL